MSVQETFLSEIAEAIRQKGGTTAQIAAKDFAQAILNLPSGGSEGITKNPSIKIASSAIQHAKRLKVHSDVELANDIRLEHLIIQDEDNRVVGIKRIDSLNFWLTCNELAVGNSIKVQALNTLYLNNNGTSNVLDINITKHILDDLYNTPEGLTDILNTASYVDSKTYAIPTNVYPWNELGVQITVNADGLISLSPIQIRINARDSSLLQLSYQKYQMRNGTEALKIRWRGLAHYSNYSTEYCWEVIFAYGTITIYLVSQPSSYFNGTFNITTPAGTFTYAISSAQPFVTFYCKELSGMSYTVVNEKCDSSKVLSLAPEVLTIDELINTGTMYMAARLFETYSDSGTYDTGIIPWSYKGSTYTTCTIGSDSWITLPGHTELIKFNRQDASVYTILKQNTTINFAGTLVKVSKIRWNGKAHWNDSDRNQIWDLYLFANGDAMIHLIKKPSANWFTNFNFFGVSYTISAESPFVSFYRQNTDGTAWTVHNSKYDISLSKNLIN